MQDHRSSLNGDISGDFRSQLSECTQKAICGRDFIRTNRFKRWLQSESSTPGKTHLELLLPKGPDQVEPPVTQQMLVDSNALVLFSILQHVNLTALLEQFFAASINDGKLPIEPHSLYTKLREVQMTDADILATEVFTTEQWKFCPATFNLDGMKIYNQNQILPIIHKEEINKKGGTANLWQIEVPEEFVGNSLREAVPYSKIDREEEGHGWVYQFALKSYKEDGMGRFQNEKNAFASLRKHDGIVRCLANFSHVDIQQDRTYNLILEYGQMDLDVYFVEYHPPFFEKEVVLFWREFFEVAKALEGIHNLQSLHDGQKYKGWHADIKPDNILLVDGKFKLADLGFVKFVPHTTEDPTELLEGCTWTWSAPEFQPGKPTPVSQKIDIWSFGCVLSIAATWVAGGDSAVKDFSKIRQKAVKSVKNSSTSSSNIPAGDLFHDGTRVLSDVIEWHKVLRQALRRKDPITDQVLDLIDQHMLLESPEARIDAQVLCEKLQNFLDNCPTDSLESISPRLKLALLENNEEANGSPPTAPPASSYQRLTDTSGNADERKMRKSQILNTPLKKTTHRSEYLISLIPDSARKSAAPSIHIDAGVLNIGSSINHKRKRIAASKPILPPLKRSMTPHKPRNYFQVANEMRRRAEKTTILSWLNKSQKDAVLAKYFNNRDIKFLIDNGFTMTEHWDQATLLLELLVQVTVNIDDNGMDASFTSGDEEIRRKSDPESFRKAMGKWQNMPQEGVQTDMKTALGRIFSEYLNYLKSPSETKRHLTLIILTDGLWEGTLDKSDVNDKVADFVEQVIEQLPLLERPVSIQFVQFGQDSEATSRLQYMDDRLKVDKDIPDVIDVERASGDVNKMLLGSFVENYDNIEHEMVSPLRTEASPPAFPSRT